MHLAARAYLGVPFLHQGRNPDVGIDCIGLLVLAARDCGLALDEHDRCNYPRNPSGGLLEQHLRAAFGAPAAGLLPGDVVAIRYCGPVRHVGIVGELKGTLTLIHTSAAPSVGRVTEHLINANWRRRIANAYRVIA